MYSNCSLVRSRIFTRNLFSVLNTGERYCCIPVERTFPNYPFVHHYRYFSFQSTVETIIKSQAGVFKALSESTPVEYAQNFLEYSHNVSGVSWWASIVLCTVMLRTFITLPFAIYHNYILAKLENLKQEMPAIVEELKKETAIAVRMFNWDEKTARYHYRRSLRKQWNNLIIRDNCHPFKATFLLWVQIPMWVSVSISLRNLVYTLPKQDFDAKLIFLELSAGGVGWIHNLTIPDPYVLPVILGLVNLAIIEMQVLSKIKSPTKLQKFITNLFRGLSIIMIPIAASVPSCVVLYWTTSSVYGLIQNVCLVSPKIRRMCRIPKTPSELERPYSFIIDGLMKKLGKK